MPLNGDDNGVGYGVKGTSRSGTGVIGESDGAGVIGKSKTWHGLYGESDSTTGGVGVWGYGINGTGVVGVGKKWHAVYGESESSVGGAGVMGLGKNGPGVIGSSKVWHGVYGESESTTGGAAVYGEGKAGRTSGVVGKSKHWFGVYGESQNPNDGAGVWGKAAGIAPGVFGESETGPGIWGRGSLAARFEGNVEVLRGDIRLQNADGAEEFDIAEAEPVDPGTVMVLDEEGSVRQSDAAYDKRVAGIVSGAGDYQPALVLDRQPERANRQPIALFGKVFCKVDAAFGAVQIGDLLTTSPTPGHAMKAEDPIKAFGAVIGKALRPLREGQGLIPVLVALQ
jgi:hypothetical protein